MCLSVVNRKQRIKVIFALIAPHTAWPVQCAFLPTPVANIYLAQPDPVAEQ